MIHVLYAVIRRLGMRLDVCASGVLERKNGNLFTEMGSK
jgi:hypothetical protein